MRRCAPLSVCVRVGWLLLRRLSGMKGQRSEKQREKAAELNSQFGREINILCLLLLASEEI